MLIMAQSLKAVIFTPAVDLIKGKSTPAKGKL